MGLVDAIKSFKQSQEVKKVTDQALRRADFPYRLTEETRGYIKDAQSSPHQNRMALIINEPHYNLDGQVNLYRFLGAFFRDNPGLERKTAFLAEGYPASQVLSVQPLIDADSSPSEELIRDVLSTYLITGYMAYEWKNQRGIPIIGTENPVFHRLSARLWTKGKEADNSAWLFSVIARNSSMTDTLIDSFRRYESPILFVGGLHLHAEINGNTNFTNLNLSIVKSFANEKEMEEMPKFQDGSIERRLRDRGIGYHFLDIKQGETTPLNGFQYQELFQAQQQGDSEGYVNRLVARREDFGVTVRPSPEDAAEYVRRIKKTDGLLPLKARELVRQAKALEKQGKFLESAIVYSAASAAAPLKQELRKEMAESLYTEFGLRLQSVFKSGEKVKGRFKRSVALDAPVIFPGFSGEINLLQPIIAKEMARISGSEGLIDQLENGYFKIRVGGEFQARTALTMGLDHIRAFEEPHKTSKDATNHVDIATKDDTAIECKNFAERSCTEENIKRWIEQAATRFTRSIYGYSYKSVLIVVPDHVNIEEVGKIALNYVSFAYSQLSGKIRVVKLSEAKGALGY